MDLNRITLIGHCGDEPTFHTMRGTSDEMARLSIATSRTWTDKDSGEKKESTTWHRVVVFNQHLVRLLERKVTKGTRLYIEGESKTRKYKHVEEERTITEVVVPNVHGQIIILGGEKVSPEHQSHDEWKRDYDNAGGGFKDDPPPV